MTEMSEPVGIGSARQAAKNVPAGGGALRRTSAQSQSTLRASIIAPAVCCTEGGVHRLRVLLHETGSENQNVFIVRAAVAELRQWLAEKKYGVKLCVASFRSCP